KSLDGSSKNIEEMNLIYLDIIIPDVSKFPKLKTLYISECLNINKLRKSSTSIESFSILKSTIETLDLSGFSALKTLLLTDCHSLNSIIIPESFPDEQRKQLENEYPGIVKFKKEYLDELQKKLEQEYQFSFPGNKIEKWYDEDNPK
ncbi:hypothetical protein JKY79_03140, partial [Candidatus Babeliales bacterium]|nr:hypothetical protein [Candidatus Babeliales bacterium]